MTGELSKNFHEVGIGPLSKILAVKEVCTGGVTCSLLKLADDKPRPLLQNSLLLRTFFNRNYFIFIHSFVRA